MRVYDATILFHTKYDAGGQNLDFLMSCINRNGGVGLCIPDKPLTKLSKVTNKYYIYPGSLINNFEIIYCYYGIIT